MLSKLSKTDLLTRFTESNSKPELDSVFRQIYVTHQRWVTKFFWERTKDSEITKDLSQEIFLRIFNDREKYQPGKCFKSWLVSYCFFIHKEFVKYQNIRNRKWPKGTLISSYSNSQIHEGSYPDPILRKNVRDSWSSLNEIQKRLLEEYHIKDIPLKELAVLHDIDYEKLRSIVKRSRKKLLRYRKQEKAHGL